MFFVSFVSMAAEPWKFWARDNENKINLNIDLYNESIEVPTMEMFGPMNGFMNGSGLYGVWSITSSKIQSEKIAIIRLSNDLGSETQEIRLTCVDDSTYQAELLKGVCMKKVVDGKKLQKITNVLTFKK